MTLQQFEGRDVVGTIVAITKAGDGLSAALAIEPQELHIGQRLQVVLDVEVGPIAFVPIKNVVNAVQRKHTLITLGATTVDDDSLRIALEQQAERIERAKGVVRLNFDPPADDGADSE